MAFSSPVDPADKVGMSLLSVAFAVVAAFVMLSLVASDRQRRLNDAESLRLAKEQQDQLDAQPPETDTL